MRRCLRRLLLALAKRLRPRRALLVVMCLLALAPAALAQCPGGICYPYYPQPSCPGGGCVPGIRDYRGPASPREAEDLGQPATIGKGTVADAVCWLRMPSGGGSAVCIRYDAGSRTAFLLTCKHVVGDDQTGTVSTPDGRSLKAKVLARDDHGDLAIVIVPDVDTIPVDPVSQHVPGISTEVWQVGYPRGQGPRTRHGRMVRPEFDDEETLSFGVVPGDSGSPVFDADGRVVGIVWGYHRAENACAVPLAEVQRFVEECLPRGERRGVSPPVTAPTSPDSAQLLQELQSIRADLESLKSQTAKPGPAGPQGERGPQGPPGPPGKDGDTAALQAEVAALRQQVQQLQDTLNKLNGSVRIHVDPPVPGK